MTVSRHVPSPEDPELTNITELLIEGSSLKKKMSSCISTETQSKYCRFKQDNGHCTVRSEDSVCEQLTSQTKHSVLQKSNIHF
jgi:hypothetical protein